MVFRDLQILTNLVNEQFRQHQHVRIMELQNHIDSVQIRLLQLGGTLGDSLSESIRLGMLAFLLATFEFPQNKEHLRYLKDRFQYSYLRIEKPLTQLSHLMLWLLIVRSMTVLDMDIPRLRSHWTAFDGSQLPWKNIRQGLQSIMWIDHIHDKFGQCIYSKLTLQEPE